MNLNLYKKVEEFVVNAFEKADKPTDAWHAKRTAYWIKKTKPTASEALLIAGLAHDIERAFHGDWKKGSADVTMLKKHQELSAKEITKFLKKEKAEEKLISEVKKLILHHEEGGNDEQNILCDADCLAYFEEKALRNAKEYKKQGKEKEMKKKLDYVFSRINLTKAKKIAQKWYDQAIKKLGYD